MSVKHANISVFVPHLGCPNKCSFCNQHYIARAEKQPTEADVKNAVQTAKLSKNYDSQNTELAFFGGSFTAIDREYMVSLLAAAHGYILSGDISGIRISTRPDAVSREILDILKQYGVTAIELGAQSTNDSVLSLNHRGHSFEDIKAASALIKGYGFSLGLQMMTGLLGSDNERDIKTAQDIIDIHPDTVRIYPTVVLDNTELANKYNTGEYRPQTVQGAVELVCELLCMFEKANINVIRTGLHTIDEEHYVAGPWHPAFAELCHSKMFLNKALEQISSRGEYIIYVNKSDVSKMIGQKRCNIDVLREKGFICSVLADENIKINEIIIKRK